GPVEACDLALYHWLLRDAHRRGGQRYRQLPRLKTVTQSSPCAAISRILSAVRQAIAWMVREGLTPPTVGNTEPSQIHKLGISQLRQSALTTLVRGLSPMRAVPAKWAVSSDSAQISRASTASSACDIKLTACFTNALSLSHREKVTRAIGKPY